MIYIGILIVVVVQQPPQEVTPEDSMVEPDGSHGSPHGYCKNCGWRKSYDTETQAKKALGAHQRFCKGRSRHLSPFSKPF